MCHLQQAAEALPAQLAKAARAEAQAIVEAVATWAWPHHALPPASSCAASAPSRAASGRSGCSGAAHLCFHSPCCWAAGCEGGPAVLPAADCRDAAGSAGRGREDWGTAGGLQGAAMKQAVWSGATHNLSHALSPLIAHKFIERFLRHFSASIYLCAKPQDMLHLKSQLPQRPSLANSEVRARTRLAADKLS